MHRPLPPLKVIDVGAMTVGADRDVDAALTKGHPCEVIGFEPVAAEFEKRIAENVPGHTFLPYFIGDGSSRTFYECNAP